MFGKEVFLSCLKSLHAFFILLLKCRNLFPLLHIYQNTPCSLGSTKVLAVQSPSNLLLMVLFPFPKGLITSCSFCTDLYIFSNYYQTVQSFIEVFSVRKDFHDHPMYLKMRPNFSWGEIPVPLTSTLAFLCHKLHLFIYSTS